MEQMQQRPSLPNSPRFRPPNATLERLKARQLLTEAQLDDICDSLAKVLPKKDTEEFLLGNTTYQVNKNVSVNVAIKAIVTNTQGSQTCRSPLAGSRSKESSATSTPLTPRLALFDTGMPEASESTKEGVIVDTWGVKPLKRTVNREESNWKSKLCCCSPTEDNDTSGSYKSSDSKNDLYY